jgi:hypothetical protein
MALGLNNTSPLILKAPMAAWSSAPMGQSMNA